MEHRGLAVGQLISRLCKALLAALLAGLSGGLIGCGGNADGILGGIAGSKVGGLQMETLPPPSGHNPRRAVSYAYGLETFPAVEGFRAVPMQGEATPDPALASKVKLEVTQQGQGRMVGIDCEPLDKLWLHFRYDAAAWDIEGLGQLNPFPEGTGFIPFAMELEPGVVLIAAEPVGGGGAQARGRVAQVHLVPKGSNRRPSAAPSNNNVYTMAFLCEGEPGSTPPMLRSFGNLNIKMDGEFGNKAHADRDGDLGDGNELSRFIWDNSTHDVELSHFGQSYGWNAAASDFSPYSAMNLSWTEHLVGDYDNNGESSISDLTPIAVHWDGPAQLFDGVALPPQKAQSACFEINNQFGQSTFFQMMCDNRPPSPGFGGGWLYQMAHIVESYYILDPADAANITGCNYQLDTTSYGADPVTGILHGVSDVKNGVDNFWDGLVRTYYNWDTNADGIADASYSYPDLSPGIPTWVGPGDALPIYFHWNEMISGYKAWTVLDSEAATFNPNSPPASALEIYNCLRESYTDKPWSDPEDSGQRSRDADLLAALTAITNFNLDALNGLPGKFDVIIAPFANVPVTPGNPVGIEFGTMTRLKEVLNATPAEYGPQYVVTGGPDDNPLGHGIVDWSNNLAEFTITYQNADNLDEWHKYVNGSKPRYQLYASTVSAIDVWNHPVAAWTEGDAGDISSGNTRFKTLNLPQFLPGQHVWMGIRCVNNTLPFGNPVEFSNPGGGWGWNNTTLGKDVSSNITYGPQYRVSTNPHDTDDHANLPRGIIAGLQSDYNNVDVVYHNSDRVVPSGGNPAWAIGQVQYRLYIGPANVNDPGVVFQGQYQVGSPWTDETIDPTMNDPNILRKSGLALPPLSVGTHYAGILAFDLSSGTPLTEYSPYALGANTTLVPLVWSIDLDPPYFIDESAPYDATATAVDDSLFLGGGGPAQTRILPYDTGALVYFRRAIDPPDYLPSSQITYTCYWSNTDFKWNELTGKQNLQKTLSYGSSVQPDGGWDYNDFSIFIPGLAAGNTYYFYVNASDTQGRTSLNTVVTQWHFQNFTNTGVTVANNVPFAVANVCGDIAVSSWGVHVVLGGQTYNEGGETYVMPDYFDLASGALPPLNQAQSIFGTPQSPTFLVTSPQPFGQSGPPTFEESVQLSICAAGQEDSLGRPARIVVAAPCMRRFFTPWESILSVDRSGQGGGWSNPVWHQLPNEVDNNGNTNSFQIDPGAPCLEYYATNLPTAPESVVLACSGIYFVFPGLYGAWTDVGAMQNGAIAWPGQLQQFDSDPTNYNCNPGTANTVDNIARSATLSSTGVGFPWPAGTFLQDGNRLYLLANSKQSEPAVVRYATCKLFDKGNPAAAWNQRDLTFNGNAALPGLNQNSTVGPNSLEITSSFDGNSTLVYTVYCTSLASNVASDALGLSIAYATHNSQGLGNWVSPPASLIDDTFATLPLVGNQPTNDQVELRVRPESKIGSTAMSGLGCAYILPNGLLMLQETDTSGPNAVWRPATIEGNPVQGGINQGVIRWTKMNYYDPDGPQGALRARAYVLYSILVDPINDLWDIRLWIQP